MNNLSSFFPFPTSLVDQALSESLLAVISPHYTDTSSIIVKRAKAFYFLTLCCFYNPEYKTPKNITVKTRVLQHIKSVISSGKEPNANGGLDGRTHNIIAQTFLLTKHIPAIWKELSPLEIQKIDWLMRAFTIAGHWSYDDNNDFYTGLNQLGNFKKSYNPNYRNGYVNVMIAASYYFGADNVNRFLQNFDYTTYMNMFQQLGFTNIYNTWIKTSKSLMESGGYDRYGGSGAGIKHSFSYQGIPLSNSISLFHTVSQFTYSEIVTNTGANGRAYLIKGSSPVVGQSGMLKEFNATDAQGKRSDAFYSYESWMNTVPTLTNLKLLGDWDVNQQNQSIEALIQVGTKDLLYKLQQGYMSYSNGKTHLSNTMEANIEGYQYDQTIWNVILKN
ncbi:hypothetical protein QUF88_10315 [Bacillus sp. DX1.1]|uniref:hypothetical protein n=1 Tax=unclassified Bacillus (in: firmicutes) TaxID=185979 RepID=UPI0025700399|nr:MULTISPECIES: hypothetical protein [unclassified Bacillus (in: firmicutes)]MDM5154216.1 hypothetical protein [Bacillus sp. DX1.1]WJE83136.1 hypothetical protein QRE67_07820 [Bacillus sp. DX3.1]